MPSVEDYIKELDEMEENPIELYQDGSLVTFEQLNDMLVSYNAYKQRLEMFKSQLLEQMSLYGITKMQTDDYTISIKKASTRKTLDSKAIEGLFDEIGFAPEEIEKYYKTSFVKESVVIKERE